MLHPSNLLTNQRIMLLRYLLLVQLLRFCSSNEYLDQNEDFTNQWAAEIQGGDEIARQVARDLGYEYQGKVSQAI